MSSIRRHPYLRGYAFWNENRFWEKMKMLSPKGRQYYENWLNELKQEIINDKTLKI